MAAISVGELLELEHAGWRSLCESWGGTYYGELMTDDGVFVLVNGAVMRRDEIAGMDGMPGWSSYEISDPLVIGLGEDAATLVYRASSTRPDLAEPFTAIMASTYCRVDGQLRLACYQQTAASL